jgi:hypothetical protein
VVEGTGGYARRNFMVPVPQVADYDDLNAYLLDCCRSDLQRRLRGRELSVKFFHQILHEDGVFGAAGVDRPLKNRAGKQLRIMAKQAENAYHSPFFVLRVDRPCSRQNAMPRDRNFIS